MNADEREEIAAAVSASGELGPRYDSAIAEGLVDRIGDEIDKRVEARLRGQRPAVPDRAPAPAPAPASPGTGVTRRGNGWTGMVLGLGSMGIGIGATAVVVGNHAPAAVFMVLLIWWAIAAINIAHARRR